jgi:ferritin-like metal-binding protein YciE
LIPKVCSPPHVYQSFGMPFAKGCSDLAKILQRDALKQQTGKTFMKKRTPASTTEPQDSESMDSELHELFLDQLADMYSAEKQLTKALPKMAKAAKSPELREAFESHLEETRNQMTRLEEVAKSLDETLKSKTCKAMKGLIEEADEILEEMKGSTALDAALIIAAQKVEHYEIATYGGLCAWAQRMGHEEAVDLLNESLAEEKSADEKLTDIAESSANEEAQG